jgi:DNA-binding protein HU-beta
MNKADLVTRISREAGITRRQAEKVLNTLIESVREALSKGDSVTLVGFGTFGVMSRAARKGRNPQTGREIFIPISKTPKFKAGKLLRQAAGGAHRGGAAGSSGTTGGAGSTGGAGPHGSGGGFPQAEGPHGTGPGF